MPRTSPYDIELSRAERDKLVSVVRKYTAPYKELMRAKIILMASEGYTNSQIAARLDLPRQIASKWRQRYFDERTTGLADLARSGRTPTFSPSGHRASQSPCLSTARETRFASFAAFEQ